MPCFQDLELSARKNSEVNEMLPEFLHAVPVENRQPHAKARFFYLQSASEWFQQQQKLFQEADDKRQLALMKILRVLIRFTLKEDDLPGFVEIIFEGATSSWVRVGWLVFHIHLLLHNWRNENGISY